MSFGEVRASPDSGLPVGRSEDRLAVVQVGLVLGATHDCKQNHEQDVQKHEDTSSQYQVGPEAHSVPLRQRTPYSLRQNEAGLSSMDGAFRSIEGPKSVDQ